MIDGSVTEQPRGGGADLVAVGHITRDVVGDATMVGGAAYYAACTAAQLGLRAAAWTSLGGDFEHRSELTGLRLAERPATLSTRFHNRYRAEGRIQRLEALASAMVTSDLPTDLRAPRAVYVCPVMGEVEPDIAGSFTAEVVGAGVQGWMRVADEHGRVSHRRWRPAAAELAAYDLVVLSDEDAAGDDDVVGYLRDRVPLVAFTHGAAGSELFQAGHRHLIPPFPTEQVGPTGAGDAYGAALVAGLLWGLEAPEAGYFASCVASVVVEAVGGAALGRVAEAWDRLPIYAEIHGVDLSRVESLRPDRRA